MKIGMRIAALAAVVGLTSVPAAAQTWVHSDAERLAGFGATLAVGDGVVLVGEPANTLRPGIVYQYGKSGMNWVEQAQIRAPDAANADGFGTGLALDGGTLLIAQSSREKVGQVHVFAREGATWQRTGEFPVAGVTASDGFGAALSVAGNWAVVGAPGAAERAGAVYVFQRSGTTWTQHAMLAPADLQAGDLFGSAIAISGNQVVVGAPGRGQRAGTAYAFDMEGGAWTESGQFAARGVQPNDQFGTSVAIRGDRVLVGAPAAGTFGAVYGFAKNARGEWAEGARLAAFDGRPRSAFGISIASDGDDVLVGAPGASGTGSIYAYHTTGDAINSVDRLFSETASGRAAFGATIQTRGDVLAVGMIGSDGGSGSVAIFERNAGEWRQASVVMSEVESLPSITGGEVKCSEEGKADIFDCGGVELVAFLPIKDIGGGRGVNVNDIWGWTDASSGREYALVGRTDGTSFIDVTDAENPKYLGDLPKTAGTPSAPWRDIKVYENHAYVVADNAGSHGMQVFDLTKLRNVTSPQTFTPELTYDQINSAHNVVINEESGFAYVVGASSGGETCGGGLHMVDIRDPKAPKFAGCFADTQTGRASTGYSHDAQCVMYKGPDARYAGHEICLGSNETALSIADVTDKANPKALSRASYPNVAYAHQGWLTDDHRYYYANDEGDESNGSVTRTRTLIWDLADLEDPQYLGAYLGETGAIDHNLYVKDNLIYESNYVAGLRILDITNPTEPVEVGFLDTLPFGENTATFAGSWSNYPFFKSGNIVVTSIGEGLFVVKKRNPSTVF